MERRSEEWWGRVDPWKDSGFDSEWVGATEGL